MEGTLDSNRFAEELQWCIGQLELGLQRQSPDSRQAMETVKVLKVLKSSKAPMVKKRQVMRNALGDYRKKMREAEKKSLSGLRHSRFQPLGGSKTSRFLKMSHSKQHSKDDINRNLQNLHLMSSELDPGSSSPSEAAECVSGLLDELVHQAYHSSGKSLSLVRPSRTDNASVQNQATDGCAEQKLQSLGVMDDVSHVAASQKRSFENSNIECSASSSQKIPSYLGHNKKYCSSSSMSSVSSSRGSSTLRKNENYKYEPSDNSFIFGFEYPENDGGSDKLMALEEDETLLSGSGNLEISSKDNQKMTPNIYKYEKSKNEFTFSFEKADDE